MIYDDEYYKNLDLNSLAYNFDNTDPDRAHNEAFSDALDAIDRKSEFEEISADELRKICGQPDELIQNEKYEIWKYLSYQKHGPTNLLSEIPFKIIDGIVHFWSNPGEVS